MHPKPHGPPAGQACRTLKKSGTKQEEHRGHCDGSTPSARGGHCQHPRAPRRVGKIWPAGLGWPQLSQERELPKARPGVLKVPWRTPHVCAQGRQRGWGKGGLFPAPETGDWGATPGTRRGEPVGVSGWKEPDKGVEGGPYKPQLASASRDS